MLETKNIKSYYISNYKKKYKEQVVDLIFSIWNKEHKFSVSYESKPDLFNIEDFYSGLKGNFWIAVTNDDKVIGSIAIENLNSGNCALKRMFVRKDFRGKGVAQTLFNQALEWAKSLDVKNVYLSTNQEKSATAIRFYKKNNFQEIDEKQAPPNFPTFKDDDVFMNLNL